MLLAVLDYGLACLLVGYGRHHHDLRNWVMTLSNCNIRGPILESLSNLNRLESLFLDGNTLNVTIPSGMLYQLPSLRYLDLSDNHFSVKELEFLRSTKQLGELDLSNNKIQERIPDDMV
ncbi:hypothetical protein CQW23_28827 [Capsicum baccatum]|uniref:Uncharacterized protein n=1 Tax=Capsicum baccatum TaxID=33114 RepID=A0A2G2VHM7_CAPBA|nr:hypothetical protein CQW23_28827 [Capsicum baccatum]